MPKAKPQPQPSAEPQQPSPQQASPGLDLLRDARLDELGMVGELWDHFDTKIRPRVKERLTAEKVDRGKGDYFEGLLLPPVPVRVIDPEKFLRLYERNIITRAEFVAAIKVGLDAATKCLSENKIAKLIDIKGPGQSTLRVSRIKGVDFTLLDAVKSVSQAVEQSLKV